MTYRIDKAFDFCYGHRVWNQTLDASYTEEGGINCKCKHLHGHNAHMTIFLESETLSNGVVTDFGNLGWLKKVIDNTLDHKFIIDRADPNFDTITGGYWPRRTFDQIMVDDFKIGEVISKAAFLKSLNVGDYNPADHAGHLEHLESFFIVNFVPTSENLSKWFFDLVSYKMGKIGVKCVGVDLWETPKSRAAYIGS